MGVPDSAGTPDVVRQLMLVAPYNDLDAARSLIESHRGEIAAVIVEPIQRIISARPEFLQGLRKITQENDILLIFDEVVTGFRLGLSGGQGYFNVTPDLATYGKAAGGAMPLGAVGGRADVMDACNPSHKGKEGYVYQMNTNAGNPIACAAALATIEVLEKPESFKELFQFASELRNGFANILRRHDIGAIPLGTGPLWHLLFTDREPRNYRDTLAADAVKARKLDILMVKHGLWIILGNRRFTSLSHTQNDLEETFSRFDAACREFNS
jgi:glutamate-1-semialdehyde 2,1-aminomutase